MNSADNMVKIYACKNATSNSIQSINTTNNTEAGDTASVLKINMSDIKLSTIMWPAVILANKRIIKANGFEIIPINSTGTMMMYNQSGISGVKMCFQ